MSRRLRQPVGEMEPQVLPRRFGNYVLVQSLAQGGMGEVYLAKYQFNGEEGTCVVKKLLKELTRDREYVTRFVDEARVVVTLEHENIAEVFDVGRAGREYYLAMEYVSGTDVKSIAERCSARGHPLAIPAALQIVIDTLAACDYAHRRRHPLTKEKMELVHRDISPHNIVVDYNGGVKLIDFGLASSRLKIEKTEPNVVMGKMAYMGPEQARGDTVDGRADLFSVAVVLYELLAGERYYAGLTPNEIWNTVGKGGFVPRRFSDIEPELQEILGKGLQPKSRKRPKDCRTFRKLLVEYLHAHFAESGEEALHREVTSLFGEEIRVEKARLEAVDAIRFSDFGPAEAPEIGRDQADPQIHGSEHSILTTREKQLVLEATEIVARRAPRFHAGIIEPSSRTSVQNPVASRGISPVVWAALAAVVLALLGGVIMLWPDGDAPADDNAVAAQEDPEDGDDNDADDEDDDPEVKKKKKRRAPATSSIKRRVGKLKRCKSTCAKSLRKKVSRYSKLSRTRKLKFASEVRSCERTCRRR